MNGARCPQFEGLETLEVALKEDDRRVDGLRQCGAKPLELCEACEDLAERISQRRIVPETPASKRYMRIMRAYITAELLELLGMVPNERVYLVTLIPVGLALTIDELMHMDPQVPKQQLRVILGRCGANPGVAGWACGYLDGEYNPATGLFQLHWHLIVTGDLVKVFERLKGRTAYKSVKRVADSPDGVATRVHIQEVDDPLNPQVITYAFKGSWYARWRGEAGDNGDEARCVVGPRTRIPEPYHSQWLLWMDKWAFDHMLININLRLGMSCPLLSGPSTMIVWIKVRVPRFLIQPEGEFPAFIRSLWRPRQQHIRPASSSQAMCEDGS
ncbi:hypothetical protein, partial [Sphingomonas hankookensis]|uniref:hypothetical protein n=1 Tax=Sphingomonas hankookensis TaxID=563996 RepID=UPI001F563E0D